MCFDERKTDRRGRPFAGFLELNGDCARAAASKAIVCLELTHFAILGPLLLLAFFAEDVLFCIFDALALVGLRRTEFADFRCNLADALLVDAGQTISVGFGTFDLMPFRGS
jgi:hypothetical protein